MPVYFCLMKNLLLVFLLSVQWSLFAQEKLTIQPYYIFPRQGIQHIDLSVDWHLSYADSVLTNITQLPGKSPVIVKEPTSVQMALYKAGILPNPYTNLNSTLYRWVEEKVWYYQKTIDIPSFAKGQNVLLCFDGLDYFSKVWVNGTLAGVHQGMFGGPTIDISSFVEYGAKNEIIVEIRAGKPGPTNASGNKPNKNGKVIHPDIFSSHPSGGSFYSLGMWQGARIEIVPVFHLERPFLKTLSVSKKEAIVHLSTEIIAHKNSTKFELHPWGNGQLNHPEEKGTSYIPVKEKISIQIEFLKGKSIAFTKVVQVNINEGRNWLEQDLTIPNPRLWNPVGIGEPELYRVRVSLLKEEKSVDQIEFDYGIRSIERVATAGPRTFDRWEDWQFIVNGRKIFLKGMNWLPMDVLLDLPEERYRFVLEEAKNMGIQLIRVWGRGLMEPDKFYKICDELGIMVWQDFIIGNSGSNDYPLDVWEELVVQNIFRLRNHPSLAVWCGGNEFNPYTIGTTPAIGVLERNLKIFDDTRLFVRTSPDGGLMHCYPDMDPTWYDRSYKYEAFIAETGMPSIPEPALLYELVDKKEFFDLGKIWDKSFPEAHPELMNHYSEYNAGRVPRMLSRASHIDNMANPTIESISEATQIGAGEWYQIMSEKMQGNYPITVGLMPWVFNRPWPSIAIQIVDGFGQPVAPYYFLKRTYEPTHVALDLPRLLWKSGETVGLKARITNAVSAFTGTKVSVIVYDEHFKQVYKAEKFTDVPEGASVKDAELGSYTIPFDYKDKFLFMVAELNDAAGNLISRSFYYPRVLNMMDDEAFYVKYLAEPISWVTLDKGPWLKPTVANSSTSLAVKLISSIPSNNSTTEIQLTVKNTGKVPAFMTTVDIVGAKRIFYASDNYFWLSIGEEKTIRMTVSFRENIIEKTVAITVGAWNAKETRILLQKK